MKALVTAEFPVDGLGELRSIGIEPTLGGWAVGHETLGGRALVDALADAAILICEIERVDAAVIAAAPALRLIGACRADPTNVDLAAAADRGIVVLRTPGRNAVSVADFTIGLLLAHARRIDRAGAHLREHGWLVDGELPYLHFRGPELAGRTLGLIGLGAIGRLVADRAAGFGMRVCASDPFVTDAPGGIELVALDELLERSDVVSIHCPLTASTQGLLGAAELARMGRDAILVNTARAAVIDEAALIDSLRTGSIAGAALDVFWEEPLPADHPLLGLDNVTLTPHVAGAAEDVPRHHARLIIDDLRAWLEGRPLRHVAVGPREVGA